jgi:flagellar FliJ protein
VTKNFPLQSILDLSQMRLDEATRRLGELLADQEKASGQMALLVQYREEYYGRFMAAAREGLSPEQWRNYQTFLDRLDSAIGQAEQMMAQSKQMTAAGQQDWLSKRGKFKAFDTLAQRHQARTDQDASRQEQKSLDEHSTRVHLAKFKEDD